MLTNRIFLTLIIVLSLVACSSKYAPLNENREHSGGYKEQLLNGNNTANETSTANNNDNANTGSVNTNTESVVARYYLTYRGTTRDSNAYITGLWHQRAKELCPKGYKVENHKQSIIYGTIKSPVNGRLETLGTQKPVDGGIIQCLT